MEPEASRPSLYVFAISHYCEKARWALDFLGVDYDLRHLAPGTHLDATRQLGSPGSSLPLLVAGGSVVHGSGAILDWAEAEFGSPTRRLSPEVAFEAECRALERRLDDVVGVHVRRYYYSEAIVEHPESVRPLFARDLGPAERESLEQSWAVVRKLMMGAMDLGPEQREDSRLIVERELDWMDGLLKDQRRFLLGDRFSRADLTAASLLAPLALPEQHPTYRMLDRPPTPVATLRRAREIGLAAGLKFVYEGNVPGEGGESTPCPSCGRTVIERRGFRLGALHLSHGHCGFCRSPVAGRWD